MKRKISTITVPGGRRTINRRKVLALAKSIELIGLINPITITGNGTLITGAHRLEAHKLLGLDEIECIVLDIDKLRTELIELDERERRNLSIPRTFSHASTLRLSLASCRSNV